MHNSRVLRPQTFDARLHRALDLVFFRRIACVEDSGAARDSLAGVAPEGLTQLQQLFDSPTRKTFHHTRLVLSPTSSGYRCSANVHVKR